MANVDTKIRALRDELSIDLSRKTNRIEQVLTTVQCLHDRNFSNENDLSYENNFSNENDLSYKSNSSNENNFSIENDLSYETLRTTNYTIFPFEFVLMCSWNYYRIKKILISEYIESRLWFVISRCSLALKELQPT